MRFVSLLFFFLPQPFIVFSLFLSLWGISGVSSNFSFRAIKFLSCFRRGRRIYEVLWLVCDGSRSWCCDATVGFCSRVGWPCFYSSIKHLSSAHLWLIRVGYRNFPKLNQFNPLQTSPNWFKPVQTSSSWSRPGQIGPDRNLVKLVETGLKLFKLVGSSLNQSESVQTSLNWSKLVRTISNWSRQVGTGLNRFGQL